MGGELKLKFLIIPTIQLLQLAKLTVFYFNKKKKKCSKNQKRIVMIAFIYVCVDKETRATGD